MLKIKVADSKMQGLLAKPDGLSPIKLSLSINTCTKTISYTELVSCSFNKFFNEEIVLNIIKCLNNSGRFLATVFDNA